jgi:hypothetical protein
MACLVSQPHFAENARKDAKVLSLIRLELYTVLAFDWLFRGMENLGPFAIQSHKPFASFLDAYARPKPCRRLPAGEEFAGDCCCYAWEEKYPTGAERAAVMLLQSARIGSGLVGICGFPPLTQTARQEWGTEAVVVLSKNGWVSHPPVISYKLMSRLIGWSPTNGYR